MGAVCVPAIYETESIKGELDESPLTHELLSPVSLYSSIVRRREKKKASSGNDEAQRNNCCRFDDGYFGSFQIPRGDRGDALEYTIRRGHLRIACGVEKRKQGKKADCDSSDHPADQTYLNRAWCAQISGHRGTRLWNGLTIVAV